MNCYFFGTFDPIHKGHIKIADFVVKNTDYKEIIFVPAFNPPHKDVSNYKDRVNMLRANGLKVDEIESKIEGVTYTYKIIERLGKSAFIIGYDAFLGIESWKNPDYLKKMLHFIVIPREISYNKDEFAKEFAKFQEKGYDFEVLDFKPVNISSSEIRKRIADNKDVEQLITKETEEYINGYGLYQNMA